MYNRVFTWVETRAKSELRVMLLPLNMLKLSSFSFFTGADFVADLLNIKNLAFALYCVCVCVGGGGGGVKTL